MKIALVVIDMQKCFLAEYEDKRAVAECCEYINHVSGMLRRIGQTVIHVQDVEDAGEVPEDQLAFADEINIAEADLRVQKEFSNAFWQTDLDGIVRAKEIDLLVLCGQAAEHCVLFTYNGAWERGHTAVVLQNGVVSRKPGRVTSLCDDRHMISYPVIELLSTQGG